MPVTPPAPPAPPAVLAGGAPLSFTALARRAAAAARALATPLAPGGPLVLPDPPLTLDTAALLLAAAARRAPLALLPPRLPAAERARLSAAVPARLPDGVAAVLFTSGSTGRRKAVLLDRAAFTAQAAASAAALGWRDDDRWLVCLPLGHIGGLSILSRCLWARRTAVLADPAPSFDPAALARQIERDRVTLVSLVPTMLARLLDLTPAWRPPPHLRAAVLGGAPARPALLARAAAAGVPVRTTYGMTETCSHVAIDGALLPGVDLRLTGPDGDRIALRGAMLFRGYAPPDHEPPAVDRDGWFVTRDRGALDPAGRLTILGRADDIIVTGGEKVDPTAVEAALESLPGVAAACVFGVPDPEWGQRVAALLVAGPGGPPRPADLTRALADRLSAHERPRRIAFAPALPLLAGGKLDRRAAARLAAPLLASLD